MPVKAGGGKARASCEAGGGPAWDAADTDAAPILPQPLRLKYCVGKIIGTFLDRLVDIMSYNTEVFFLFKKQTQIVHDYRLLKTSYTKGYFFGRWMRRARVRYPVGPF